MLEIRQISKSFGGVKAIDRCSFDVEEKMIVALIGPNGAGKTTMFDIITGFCSPDSGEILLNGKPINGMPPYKIARLGITRTFQLTRLFPKLTVMENMLLARQQQGESLLSALTGRFEKDEQKVMEHLHLVKLEGKKDDNASSLSYGQQKLAEIARALTTDADILLLDEPAAGVSPQLRKELKKIIYSLKEQGKTILIIEHDMPFVMGIADKVVVLDHGQEIAVGKPKEVQKNKKVLDAYLGNI